MVLNTTAQKKSNIFDHSKKTLNYLLVLTLFLYFFAQINIVNSLIPPINHNMHWSRKYQDDGLESRLYNFF